MAMTTLLIVDHDDDLRDTLEDSLDEMGFDCLSVISAEDSIDVLGIFNPEIAIVDASLSSNDDESSVKIVQRLRPNCAVIATHADWDGLDQDAVLQKALEVGANRAVGKPYTVDDMVKVIEIVKRQRSAG
jgi:DNA-binding response OmpR family regulator